MTANLQLKAVKFLCVCMRELYVVDLETHHSHDTGIIKHQL